MITKIIEIPRKKLPERNKEGIYQVDEDLENALNDILAKEGENGWSYYDIKKVGDQYVLVLYKEIK